MIKAETKTGEADALIARLGAANVDAVVRTAAFSVEAHAKTAIQTGQKSGRIYKRKGREHQASAPGEAPATDIGNLVNSIGARREGPGEWVVAATAEQAAELELRKNRPFLLPALMSVKKGFIAAAEALIKG